MAVAVAAAEGLLALAGFSQPQFYTWDAQLGAALRPGARGWWTKEGRAYVTINSAGLRDHEHGTAREPGIFRVAVLGDSYAEALQVPLEKTFWAEMERSLASCAALGGRRVEAINFGVSGYGTAQELLMLRHRVWSYAPDAVLLAVTTGNDVSNNLRELEGDPYRPYFVFRGGTLTEDDSFKRLAPFSSRPRQLAVGVLNWLGDRSRLVQLLRSAKERLQASHARRPARTATEPGLDEQVYLPSGDLRWQEAWKVTEGILGLLSAEVRGHGAVLLVTTLSNGIQVHPDRAAREAVRRRLGIDDLFGPERRFRGIGRRLQIPVLSLAPQLAAQAEREGIFLHGFGPDRGSGHWNELGHRHAGERVAAAFCRLLAGSWDENEENPFPGKGYAARSAPPAGSER